MLIRTIFGFAAAALAAGWGQEQPPFALPGTVELRAGLVYSRVGSRELRLDLFLPKEGAGPFPAVVYIHGGGWEGGSKAAFRRQAAHMAARGYAGACIEYRLSGEAHYPAALHDAKAAVRWVRANARQYRIDPERIGAAGGSAGGHLAALLGTTGGMARMEGEGGNPEQSSRVRAVAGFNPALDMTMFGKAGPGAAVNAAVKFLGKTYAEAPELWADASPMTHAGANSAPMLLLHGDADQTVPYRQSVEMMEKLKAAGVHAELFTAKGAAHGFFNRPPFFQPALERMQQFFDEFLRR